MHRLPTTLPFRVKAIKQLRSLCREARWPLTGEVPRRMADIDRRIDRPHDRSQLHTLIQEILCSVGMEI